MYFVVSLLFLSALANSAKLSLKDLASNNLCNEVYRRSLPTALQDNIKCFNNYDSYDAKRINPSAPNVCDNQVCACYFEIKGATDQSNIAVGNGQFKFSVVKARDICDQYNATLPTIHDPYEFNAAVASLLSSDTCGHKDDVKNPVALGMVKGDGPQIGSWDDGFAPTNTWESSWYRSWSGNDSLHAHDTFTITDGTNLFTYKLNDATEKVHVICKQELLNRRILPATGPGTDDHDHNAPPVAPTTDDHDHNAPPVTPTTDDHDRNNKGNDDKHPPTVTNDDRGHNATPDEKDKAHKNDDKDNKPASDDRAGKDHGNGGTAAKMSGSFMMLIMGVIMRYIF